MVASLPSGRATPAFSSLIRFHRRAFGGVRGGEDARSPLKHELTSATLVPQFQTIIGSLKDVKMNQGSLVAIAPCLFSANAQCYWQCICFYVLHLRMRRCIVQLGLCLATSLQEPAADTHLSTANDPVTGPCFVYCGELLLIPFATRSNVHASYSTVDGMASHLNIILCFPLTHACGISRVFFLYL